MIVWIDGAFGSGKTTLVAELHRQWPEALVFDAEHIGYVLREIVEVPTGNFQDLPLWRTQVAAMAIGLVEEYARPLLVPMTLVEAGYAEEIFTAVRRRGIVLQHVYLDVPADELARRIGVRVHAPGDPAREARVRAWGVAQIDRCAAARALLPRDTLVLDGRRPVAELAAEVLALRQAPGGARRSPA
ncbi:AAA family ATPase [Pseudonocardia sp. DLS-67]